VFHKYTDCSLLQRLRIDPAGREVYDRLAAFHYRDGRLGPYTHLFALLDDDWRRQMMVPAVGVIVYRMPAANLAARNAVTDGWFAGLDRAAGLALLNAHVQCISRVIIDPRYRGLGLAARLVRETMPLTGAAMVEALSVMGMVSPFFERAGMRAFDPAPDVKTERMAAALETIGIGRRLWIDPRAVQNRIDALDRRRRAFIEQQLAGFLQKFARQRHWPGGLARTDFVLSKLGHPGRYYAWLNPDKPIRGLTID
jgi:GNAT superfamily N-acetyltransferase